MSSIFSLGSDVSFETIRPMVLVVLVISACALIYALILSTLVNKEDEGTDKMKEIAQAIRESA